MTTDWDIERITVSELQKLTDKTPLMHPGLEAVRQELFTRLSPKEFQNRYTKLLTIDSQQVARLPQVNNRGAEAYWLRNKSDPIAVLILHFYNWQILAPQICFQADRQNSKNISLRLARFEELVKPQFTSRLATELSSIWVAPDHRGRGLGKFLFKKALEVFNTFLGKGDYGFMAARGKLGNKKSRVINQYLLANEEKVNGHSPVTGDVHITGIKIPVEELNETLGFNCGYFPIHPNSISTVVLAERADMKFIGYSKFTNSIYGKVWR